MTSREAFKFLLFFKKRNPWKKIYIFMDLFFIRSSKKACGQWRIYCKPSKCQQKIQKELLFKLNKHGSETLRWLGLHTQLWCKYTHTHTHILTEQGESEVAFTIEGCRPWNHNTTMVMEMGMGSLCSREWYNETTSGLYTWHLMESGGSMVYTSITITITMYI